MTRCPSNVVETRAQDIVFLCERMRADEIEQLDAFYEIEPEHLAGFFLAKRGPRFTLLDRDGLPVVAGGFESISDGVLQSWMVGREDGWDDHWRSITKATRWLMDRLLESPGVRRLQTNALASRTAACEWYVQGLHMQPEGVWRRFGRQGQDVAAFARVAED